jgi:hypothetical protein
VSRCPCGRTSVYHSPLRRAWQTDLECEARFDLLGKDIGDGFVKVKQDLHGELRFYPALGNEVVQRVREGTTQTVLS